MTIEGLPLRHGASGDAVRDLQRRLVAAGHRCDEAGEYGDATRRAVEAFQRDRGLLVDGVCGRDTWAALVEAGYRLGDRLLYLRSPMMRGDDVAALQRQLSGLGFDAGRIDGILGPQTERALKDFQRNSGVTIDGVCGPDVLRCLSRLGDAGTATTAVAGVRERDRLRHAPRELSGQRVVVGEPGGLAVLADDCRRELQDRGARVVTLHDPDPSAQATEANAFEAAAYVGVQASHDGRTRIAYYATPGFESEGGRQLAELLADALTPVLEDERPDVVGLRSAVLRETRMPAVVCHLGSPDPAVQDPAALAGGVADAVARWFDAPLPG